MGNYVKAIILCLSKSYSYLEPTMWKNAVFSNSPFQEHTDYLSKAAKPKEVPKDEGY